MGPIIIRNLNVSIRCAANNRAQARTKIYQLNFIQRFREFEKEEVSECGAETRDIDQLIDKIIVLER